MARPPDRPDPPGDDRREAIPWGPVGRGQGRRRAWLGEAELWEIVERPGLTVLEARLPAGKEDDRHRHARARQVFYFIEGVLELTLDGVTRRLEPGAAQEVPPLCPHRARNPGPDDARFLVISAPAASGDRERL